MVLFFSQVVSCILKTGDLLLGVCRLEIKNKCVVLFLALERQVLFH